MGVVTAAFLAIALSEVSGQQTDSTGAVRVFILRAPDFLPAIGATLMAIGTPNGAMTGSTGEALVNNLPADTCRLIACRVGLDDADFKLLVPAGGVTDTVVFLEWQVACIRPIIMTDPADTLAIHAAESLLSLPPPQDTLSIDSWIVCSLDSASVVSDGSTHLESSFDSIMHSDNRLTNRGMHAGRLLHLLSLSQPSEEDSASILDSDHARDASITLAPFAAGLPDTVWWDGDPPKHWWNGELDIVWFQAGPSERRRTSVESQYRVMREEAAGFGEWSRWFDGVYDINTYGLLDSVLAVQVRLHLHTDDPMYTPVISEVRMIRRFI